VLAVVGGRADALFLVAALPMVVVALAAWLLLRFARPLRAPLTREEKARRSNQAQFIEVEIAERSAALRNRSKNET
jgi:hypothetical protein